MRKTMELLSKKVTSNIGGGKVIRFTENPVNVPENGRYFLEFYGTYKVIRAWKTMSEAIDGLKDICNNGLYDNNCYCEIYYEYKEV